MANYEIIYQAHYDGNGELVYAEREPVSGILAFPINESIIIISENRGEQTEKSRSIPVSNAAFDVNYHLRANSIPPSYSVSIKNIGGSAGRYIVKPTERATTNIVGMLEYDNKNGILIKPIDKTEPFVSEELNNIDYIVEFPLQHHSDIYPWMPNISKKLNTVLTSSGGKINLY